MENKDVVGNIVGVGIIGCKGKYLVLKRSSDSTFYPGVYEPLCIFLKEFESPGQSVLRQLKEKTGLNGKVMKPGKIFEVRDEHGRWIVVPFLIEEPFLCL